jgi:tetratricopeptide (TPR) repeat protein
MHLALATQDWARVEQDASALDAAEEKLAAAQAGAGVSLPSTFIWPVRAYAEAGMGNSAAAHRWIDKTPADCDLCLRMRGRIDEAEKNQAGADYWFARAEGLAPSIPFADEDWGRALLARGDAAGAVAKFKLSNAKGPHFADALEGWGEALMAQNRSDLALAKFAEAEKYAPNWGRLHLKWGEALFYAGKKDDAKKQFAAAAALDLTAAEKMELAGMAHV